MTDFKKSNLLKLELLHPFVKYAITLNPNDARQFWDLYNENRVQSMEGYVNTYLLKYYKDFCSLIIYMESSPNGRLHFHGTIMFYCYGDIKRFVLSEINKIQKQWHIDMDTIKDEKIWETYCSKQNRFFEGPYKTNDLFKIQQYGVSLPTEAPQAPPADSPTAKPINKKKNKDKAV